MQNLTGFIFPHPDTPKTHPISDPNHRRGAFRGVCNTPLHGYMQNLAGFIFPHPDAPKTCPVFPFPIRIHPKPARFYTQIIVAGHFRAYAIRPYTGTPKKLSGFIFPHTDTPKTCPILDPNPCRRTFRGVCNTPLHGCAQNLPDFGPKPSSQDISGRMQYAPTRVRAKPARFHISTPGCTPKRTPFHPSQ